MAERINHRRRLNRNKNQPVTNWVIIAHLLPTHLEILMMKRFAFALLFPLLAWNGIITAQTQAATPMDDIAAVVNEEVITQQELAERLVLSRKQMANNPDFANIPEAAIRQQVLQAMISEAVMRQFARNNGLLPSGREVEATLAAQMAASGKSAKAFETEAQAQGLTLKMLREQIRLQYVVAQIRNQVIMPTIKIRAAEIDGFMSEHLSNKNASAEVNVAHIVVKVADGAGAIGQAAAEEKFNKVLAALKAGQEFTDVAARLSDFSDAASGGLLGWRPITRLPDAYQLALKTMQPGQVSARINTENGYHLIKLIDKREQAQQIVERIRARHILLRVDEKRAEEQVISEINALSKRLKAGEDFAELAKKYSQDGSAKLGGDLGWLYPGDTVAEFEQALGKLATGSVSDPVRTPFGWHIIEAQARESVPLPEEKARQIAKRVLTDERMADAFRRWLDEQVAKTYVRVASK